jgi:predicted ATPase
VIDEERTMSFTDSVAFQAALKDVYERTGYALVEVPRDSAEGRAAFVRDSSSGAVGVGFRQPL